MNDPIVLIQNNEPLTLIKNIVYILFLIITAFVAILTYTKARKTILQPLKAETAKKQFELLTQLLNDLGANASIDLLSNFDYRNIVKINVFYHLEDMNLYHINEVMNKEINIKMSKRCIFFQDSIQPGHMQSIPIFDKQNNDNKIDYRKDLNAKAFEGNVSIALLYFTNTCTSFLNKLSTYSQNPFLPNDIVETIKLLNSEFSANLRIIKQEIEDFIKIYAKKIKTNESTKFNIDGLYNKINHKLNHHTQTLASLLSTIKNHLCIEEKW